MKTAVVLRQRGRGAIPRRIAAGCGFESVDLHLLEIFCHVFRERSFSRAARNLGLTQPTVSLHIRQFERAVGTPLFNRLGREIEPTAAGRFLYQHGSAILVLKRHLREKMAEFLNRVEGDLLIGASSMPGEYLLPPIIAVFQRDHPAVCAHLRISDTAATIADLKHGAVELGVVGARTDDRDLVFEPLASDSLVLIVPPTQEWQQREQLSLRELRQLPLIVREVGSGTRSSLERALTARGLELTQFRVNAEFGSTTAIKRAVAGGHGVSFVPGLAIAAELAAAALRVVRVVGLGSITRTYHTVRSRRRALSPLTAAFMRHLDAQRQAGGRERRRPARRRTTGV